MKCRRNGMCCVHRIARCTFMFVIVFWHAIKLVFNLECSSLNATVFVLCFFVFFLITSAAGALYRMLMFLFSFLWVHSKQSYVKRISFIFVWMCDLQLMLQWFLYVQWIMGEHLSKTPIVLIFFLPFIYCCCVFLYFIFKSIAINISDRWVLFFHCE